MALDVHAFTGRDGELRASTTLSDGTRSKPRKLSKRNAGVLMELMREHKLYSAQKGKDK